MKKTLHKRVNNFSKTQSFKAGDNLTEEQNKLLKVKKSTTQDGERYFKASYINTACITTMKALIAFSKIMSSTQSA